MQVKGYARAGLGDTASDSLWSGVTDLVKNVASSVTQYQFNKQAIKAGNVSAAQYTPTTAGAPSPSGNMTPLLIGALALGGIVYLVSRRRR